MLGGAEKLVWATFAAFAAARHSHCRWCCNNFSGERKAERISNQDIPEGRQLPGSSGRRQTLRQMRSIPTAERLQGGRRRNQPAGLLPDLRSEPPSAAALVDGFIDSLLNGLSQVDWRSAERVACNAASAGEGCRDPEVCADYA